MARYDQVWQDMTRYDQVWQDMTRYAKCDQVWQDITCDTRLDLYDNCCLDGDDRARTIRKESTYLSFL